MKKEIIEIKKIPILKVAEQLGYTIHQNNMVSCKGPIHKNGDNKPSLKLYIDTNSFFCYTCKEGGDVIAFTSFSLGCSFKEALSFLKEIK